MNLNEVIEATEAEMLVEPAFTVDLEAACASDLMANGDPVYARQRGESARDHVNRVAGDLDGHISGLERRERKSAV